MTGAMHPPTGPPPDQPHNDAHGNDDDDVHDNNAQGNDRSPAHAWAELHLGNRRFVEGTPSHPRQDVERREQLVAAQAPRAALFGCSDSRLAAEIIFDNGLGDLFVVRNAGQVISDSVIGSLEYAVAVLHVPLIVVLGHDECGAVKAAIDSQAPNAPPLPPHIHQLIEKIIPAVTRVTMRTGTPTIGPDSTEVGREHLRDTVAELLHTSELISDAIAAGTLAIVGANYRLLEGTAVPDIIVGAIPNPN
jgi:carbonic anhydrase